MVTIGRCSPAFGRRDGETECVTTGAAKPGDDTRHVLYGGPDEASAESTSAGVRAEDAALRVSTADSVAEARTLLGRGPPVDCVVSGYLLDDADGVSFLRSVRGGDDGLSTILFAEADETVSDTVLDTGLDYVPRCEGYDSVAFLARRIRALTAPDDAEGSAAPRTSDF